jgi:transcriptional regulator with XRE-family HTH domain
MASQRNRDIVERLRRARKQAGLSQVELAKLCNVTQATVQKIETGRSTNSRFLAKIWARLGLPLDELDPDYSSAVSVSDKGGPGAHPAPRSLSAAAGDYDIQWESGPPVWQAYDVVDLHYGRAISKETGREGVAIMWRLRDGSYLIGVIDAETARRSLKLNQFQTIVEELTAAASPKR